MRVFVAGATGAVGRPMMRRLIAAGHEVVALTRDDGKADRLREQGASAVVGDAFDADGLRDTLAKAQPEVVIDQMTDLPQRVGFRGMGRFYKRQNRLRAHASRNLQEAAGLCGARRVISQSVAFIYAPGGSGAKTEVDRVWDDAPGAFGKALRIAAAHDRNVVEEKRLEGVVLRYGVFYGPGTAFSPGNGIYEDIRGRRMPIVGAGESRWSFCHVEDAAEAAVHALNHGERGIYNVCDDDPAPMREWLPHFAATISAKPPIHIPRWLSHIAAGAAITAWATALPGASNAKARGELGWTPTYPSWRQGFAANVQAQ